MKIAKNSQLRRELEDDIAYRSGLEPGYVAIDVPSVKLLSEPRMTQVDVKVIGKDGKTRWLREMTPMAEALRKRQVSQDAVYVMTFARKRAKGVRNRPAKTFFLMQKSSLFTWNIEKGSILSKTRPASGTSVSLVTKWTVR